MGMSKALVGEGGHEGRGNKKRHIIKFDCSSRIPDECANVETR